MAQQQTGSFVFEYGGISNVIPTPVKITPQYNASIGPIRVGENMQLDSSPSDPNEFIALWDTGATSTCVTPNVLASVQLPQVGIRQCGDPSGVRNRRVFLGCLYLPNQVYFDRIELIEVDQIAGADMLIGMDIISLGDFAITGSQGKTVFSYQYPSQERIDFVQQHNHALKAQYGRNDPCPCNSGLKFKKCHGK